jgi:hypothetical protein
MENGTDPTGSTSNGVYHRPHPALGADGGNSNQIPGNNEILLLRTQIHRIFIWRKRP